MTNEPVRWMRGGSDAERELLELLGQERPSDQLSARMRSVVLAPALASLAGAAGSAGASGAVAGTSTALGTSTTLGTSSTASASTGLGAGAIALGSLIALGVVGLGLYLGSGANESAKDAPASVQSPMGPQTRDAEPRQPGAEPLDAQQQTSQPLGGPASAEATPASSTKQPPVEAARGTRASTRGATSSSAAGVTAAKPPTAEVSDTSSLSRELTILEQARRAIDRSDREVATRLLGAYRAEYPNGQLKSEANVLEQRARSIR